MIALLDVNVLLALVDRGHSHFEPAVAFFRSASSQGWATCPLTENSFLRILGNPAYPGYPGTMEDTRTLLEAYRSAPGHRFWPDDLTLTDRRDFPVLAGPRALTDVYLLALAVKNGGRLVTFDRRIDANSVPGGSRALQLLS